MRPKDDIRARSIKDKMRWKKREWTKPLRIHKRRELTRKYRGEDKIRFLQKMMAPSEEFAGMTEDVRKAKKEIQEANMTGTKGRKLTKKALKSRLVSILGFFGIGFRLDLSLEFYFRNFIPSLSSLYTKSFLILYIFALFKCNFLFHFIDYLLFIINIR